MSTKHKVRFHTETDDRETKKCYICKHRNVKPYIVNMEVCACCNHTFCNDCMEDYWYSGTMCNECEFTMSWSYTACFKHNICIDIL